jgi:hypothetical protein
MTLTLPLPHRGLSPNARSHWRNRHRLTKRARWVAKCVTLAALAGEASPVFTRYTLTFFFPNAIHRDDDNAAASCKAYRDGIADALGIDDHGLRLAEAPTILIDRQKPRLEITLLP